MATGADAVTAANAAFGQHPGFRALHAKGTLLKGTFSATPEAAALTRAAHFQGSPVAATIRVSNGGGDPDVPDFVPDVRGLAVKFYLPDGSRTDLVAQTLPRFPVGEPEAFIELLRIQADGPAAAAMRLPRFLARHRSVLASLPANTLPLLPPASYATIPYFAIHAFRFLDAAGGSRDVRYTLRPEAAVARLDPLSARRRGRDYLQEEIRARLARGPVRFTVELQIAGPGDDLDDPTRTWPRDRQIVTAGALDITDVETGRETGGDVLVFDPTRITDGIELSGDPILRFRHQAYTESVARRMASA